jgi:predicted DNA-binding antitoxin AbrB/MazE fold protein
VTTTVEAIYENGMLKLPQALDLPEKSSVLVTIQTQPTTDSERAAWLHLSREALLKTWDNSDDDRFNELLDR